MTKTVDRTTARKTTLIVAIVSLVVGAWQVYRGRPTAATVLIGSGGVLTIAAFVPVAALWFHHGWMRFAEILGFVNTRIILTVVFYLVFTPIKFIARLAGHDPLSRRTGRQSSYWVTREQRTRQSFERAF